MRRVFVFLFTTALTAVISAALTGRLTVMAIVTQTVYIAGIIGPIYLMPRSWSARCRIP